jgi:U3 small nucleolar RNA-associated protein 4
VDVTEVFPWTCLELNSVCTILFKNDDDDDDDDDIFQYGLGGCTICSAMCVIDFSKLMLEEEVDRAHDDAAVNAAGNQEHGNGTRKVVVHGNGNGNGSKHDGRSVPKKSIGTKFVPFRNPVLFLGHTGLSSVFVVEKPWSEVLQQFPAPVFRHVFGT